MVSNCSTKLGKKYRLKNALEASIDSNTTKSTNLNRYISEKSSLNPPKKVLPQRILFHTDFNYTQSWRIKRFARDNRVWVCYSTVTLIWKGHYYILFLWIIQKRKKKIFLCVVFLKFFAVSNWIWNWNFFPSVVHGAHLLRIPFFHITRRKWLMKKIVFSFLSLLFFGKRKDKKSEF